MADGGQEGGGGHSAVHATRGAGGREPCVAQRSRATGAEPRPAAPRSLLAAAPVHEAAGSHGAIGKRPRVLGALRLQGETAGGNGRARGVGRLRAGRRQAGCLPACAHASAAYARCCCSNRRQGGARKGKGDERAASRGGARGRAAAALAWWGWGAVGPTGSCCPWSVRLLADARPAGRRAFWGNSGVGELPAPARGPWRLPAAARTPCSHSRCSSLSEGSTNSASWSAAQPSSLAVEASLSATEGAGWRDAIVQDWTGSSRRAKTSRWGAGSPHKSWLHLERPLHVLRIRCRPAHTCHVASLERMASGPAQQGSLQAHPPPPSRPPSLHKLRHLPHGAARHLCAPCSSPVLMHVTAAAWH